MTGPRRAPAPPLRLRLRSGTAARHTISYETKTRKPDGGWGHFKPSRWASANRRSERGLQHPYPVVEGKAGMLMLIVALGRAGQDKVTLLWGVVRAGRLSGR